MTTIAAAFVASGAAAPEAEVRRMLRDRARRGGGGRAHGRVRTAVRGDDRAAVGAARPLWQAAPGLGGTVLVAERERVVVAADAALYYRADLRATILGRGVAVAGDDPAELIAAAYLAFGDAAVGRLEGDYAFVLWDGRRRRVLAARDHGGRRPLYYAALGDTLVFASSTTAVLAHPACPRALNLAAIAETAAGFLGATSETAHAAVRRLSAGCLLARDADGRVSVARHSPASRERGPRGARAGHSLRPADPAGSPVFTAPTIARPSRTGGRAAGAMRGRRAAACLLFDGPAAVRRVWDYPLDWQRLPDAALVRLSWRR